MYFIWLAAGCTVLATIISLLQIREHLIESRHPLLRKYTVRILAMVPLYSLESFLGMVFYRESVGIGLVRECYESVVLYSFYQFLVVSLGGSRNLSDMLAYKPPVHHTWPLHWMRPWSMGNTFLKLTTVGILQYVPIKVLCSLAAAVTYMAGDYMNGRFEARNAYPWITLIVNFSQMWALYCLFLFYLGAREELAPFREQAGYSSRIQQIVGILAYESPAVSSPVAHLLDPSQRQVVADVVGRAIFEEKGIGHPDASLAERLMDQLVDAQQVLYYCGGDTGYRNYAGSGWRW